MKRASVVSLAAAALAWLPGCITANADEGIWKAYVPPAGSMRGEFLNHDPMGLGAGAEIATDCSLNWVDPNDHRLYCFSSGTSLEVFLEAPQLHLAQARSYWVKLHPTQE